MYLSGDVVAQSGEKTVRVRVTRKYSHPVYHKVLSRHKDYLVHDPTGGASVGSVVSITPCRPFSRRKRWMIVKSN